MIAQLLLTAVLAVILLYAWLQYRGAPVIGLGAMLAAFAGLYLVWMPSHATRLAAFIGIGRGVDLVLYAWVAISLLMLLNLHLKLRQQIELITGLTRALAIAEAERDLADAPRLGDPGAGDRPGKPAAPARQPRQKSPLRA